MKYPTASGDQPRVVPVGAAVTATLVATAPWVNGPRYQYGPSTVAATPVSALVTPTAPTLPAGPYHLEYR